MLPNQVRVLLLPLTRPLLGLRDLDTARRNITERYLLKCNEIFVVASEGRATTDEGVQSVIELAKKAKLSNVGIICTKSDVSRHLLMRQVIRIGECLLVFRKSIPKRP